MPLLVETKLAPPRPHADVVARTRLFRELDRLSDTALTLVDAPVGYGKTMLVQSWCGARPDTPVAWVSLDARDDDPLALWTYVAAGVDRVRSGLGAPALRRLRAPGAAVDPAVDELLNALSSFAAPVVVVLDDLHLVNDVDCLSSLERAVDRLPANARIVATSRVDPPMGLGRLRGRHALGEIRSADLAFTLEEARELLVEREGIRLGDADLASLLDRTEGWPAGLYLAALWLRGVDDPAEGVRLFAGDHRHVADYLSSEVLQSLDSDQRQFLLRTSVLGHFSAALADSVLGRDDSRQLIGQIERSNLFLVALDHRGEWFRYHHLFAALLELELANEDPSAARDLHGLAYAWSRDQGLIEDALEHAAAAGDWEAVADTLAEHHLALLRSGRPATVVRWLDVLPADQFSAHPALAPAGAFLAGMLRRPEERRRYLALAERERAEAEGRWSDYAEQVFHVAHAAFVEEDVGLAVAHARRAAELARAAETPLTTGPLAVLALTLELSGELDEADTAAREAIAQPGAEAQTHGLVVAHGALALVALGRGSPRPAETHARRAIELARQFGLADATSVAVAHTALAAALASQGRAREAAREAEKGERLCRYPEPEAIHLRALLVLAESLALTGELARAKGAVGRAREPIDGFADPGVLPGLLERAEETIAAAEAGVHAPIELPSEAELAVLRLLPTDLSLREIGGRLFLSLNTVKTHTRGVYRKLGVTSREEAVTRAAGLGLLEESAAGDPAAR